MCWFLYQVERVKLFPLLPFCSIRSLKGLSEAHARWRGPSALHDSPIQMFHPETSSQANTEIMFSQMSRHLMIQSS